MARPASTAKRSVARHHWNWSL